MAAARGSCRKLAKSYSQWRRQRENWPAAAYLRQPAILWPPVCLRLPKSISVWRLQPNLAMLALWLSGWRRRLAMAACAVAQLAKIYKEMK